MQPGPGDRRPHDSAPPGPFLRRRLTLAPGEVRPYVEREWRGAIVTVSAGELGLVCTQGGERCFGRGSIVWFDGIGLARIEQRGEHPTVLVAVQRRRDAVDPPG